MDQKFKLRKNGNFLSRADSQSLCRAWHQTVRDWHNVIQINPVRSVFFERCIMTLALLFSLFIEGLRTLRKWSKVRIEEKMETFWTRSTSGSEPFTFIEGLRMFRPFFPDQSIGTIQGNARVTFLSTNVYICGVYIIVRSKVTPKSTILPGTEILSLLEQKLSLFFSS